MTQRKILKFFVLIIGILSANLVTTEIDTYFLSHKTMTRPFVFTWIGMLIIIAIYYPLFTFIDRWAISLSELLLKKGKVIIGRGLGVYLFALICLLILYYMYGKLWYNSNVFYSFITYLQQ